MRFIRVLTALITAAGSLTVATAPAAQATTCSGPALVNDPINLYSHGSSGTFVGTLYLGWFQNCRQAYAEFHWNQSYLDFISVASVHIDICIHNDVTGYEPGCQWYNSYTGIPTWSDSLFIPIDTGGIYHDAAPTFSMDYYWNGDYHSCGAEGDTHDFGNGNNTWTLDSGTWGNC